MASDMKVLRFTDNELSFLGIDAFHAYQALQHIYLGRNHIQTVAPEAFRALRNLQILDFEANRLRTVPTPAFRHISSVRIISLKSNPITYITEDAFRPLVNLEELNLENCWLNRVQPGAFAGLTVLGELNLVNNELAGLPADMRSDLPPTLTVLRLHRNPWKCDCRLRWLRRFVDAGTSSSVNWDFAAHNTPVCAGPELLRGVSWRHLAADQFACTPVCAGPELLRGVSWRHLAADQFACPPTQVVGNGTTSVELHVGANASIACVVGGDPPPVVTWMKGTSYVADELVVQTTEAPGSDDEPTRLHSVLRLTGVTRQDAGDYKCVAANPAGRSEVTYKVWVVDGMRGGVRQHKPTHGRGTQAADDGDPLFGVGIEVVLGAAAGIMILIAALCAYVTFFVVRKRQVRQNVPRGRKEPSARNSYMLTGGTLVSRNSNDEFVAIHETAAVEMNCRPNHNDVRHVFPNAVVVAPDVQSVHVVPYQFEARPTAADDDENSPSEFAMKIFAGNPPVDAEDSPSPTVDVTPSPPPADCVDNAVEPSSATLAQRSAELDSSSPVHADDDSCSTRPTATVEHSYSTSHSDEQRRCDRSKDIYATCSVSHASHCANPVCLRERLLDRSSSSLPPGDMCSHRLALSSRTSSPDHGRVRVAVLQRPRCPPANVRDVDSGGSPPCRRLSSGSRTSNRRNSSSRTADVGYYSTLPPPQVAESDRHSPRRLLGHSQRSAVDAGPYGSTMPRPHRRVLTANDRRQQRELGSTGKLSGSSSALDIRDLEMAATTSPYSMTSRAKSSAAPSTTVATSLHDILSPPFGPPTANGPKPTSGNALRVKPGDQDEFGTAV